MRRPARYQRQHHESNRGRQRLERKQYRARRWIVPILRPPWKKRREDLWIVYQWLQPEQRFAASQSQPERKKERHHRPDAIRFGIEDRDRKSTPSELQS